ncbi:MAG: hypothetical protein HQ581_21170 [Planctomycetes bacterium]|nr:hypothetical protein [Planctomycetota bacterium]
MRFSQATAYTACDRYIRTIITAYGSVCNRVSDAFREHCGSESRAEQALTLGRYPLIHIGNVPCGINGRYRGRSGGPRHTVYINTNVADEYEIGGRILIFESTVLHEMVHWARFVSRSSRRINGQEAGKAFEIAAYGRDISCGCYDSCESP